MSRNLTDQSLTDASRETWERILRRGFKYPVLTARFDISEDEVELGTNDLVFLMMEFAEEAGIDLKQYGRRLVGESVREGELLTRLNARICALLDRDHQIGHSYFLDLDSADDLHFAWYTRVVPLLQEYFYNDGERLRAVIGDKFMCPVGVDEATRRRLGDLYDAEQSKYEIRMTDGGEFLSAMRELAGD